MSVSITKIHTTGTHRAIFDIVMGDDDVLARVVHGFPFIPQVVFVMPGSAYGGPTPAAAPNLNISLLGENHIDISKDAGPDTYVSFRLYVGRLPQDYGI